MTLELSRVQTAVSAEVLYRAVAGAILVALAAAALWNAHTLSPALGYDAVQHQEYAHLLVEEGRIPEKDVERRSLYDNPPGFYAVAGVANLVGERLGLADPHSAVQFLNGLFVVAAALLVLGLARLLWPGRPVLQLAALAFFAFVPVVVKAAAMYHPGALALLLSAAALYLVARMMVRGDYRLRAAAALALVLLAGLGVMFHTLWIYASVLLALGVAAAADPRARGPALRAIAVVIAFTVVAGAPFAARQAARGVPVLGQLPSVGDAPWSARSASFFTEVGLPEVATSPYREAFRNRLLPTAYSELWGDYFGVYAWNSVVDPEPARSTARQLALQNWLGLPPTLLALAGWLAACAVLVRRRGAQPAHALVAVLPALALAGFVHYGANATTVDGDTLKASYMLTAAPAWALAFGFAVDRLTGGWPRRALAVALVAAALVNLRFLVAASPLGGLL